MNASLPWESFVWDVNSDGRFTVTDVGLWLQILFFLPGDTLIWLSLEYAPEITQFFEVDAAQFEEQDQEQATYAPKITRELAHISWDEPAERVARQVRAFDPRPGAWTTLGGREVKLYGPMPADEWEVDEVPGEVVETHGLAFAVEEADERRVKTVTVSQTVLEKLEEAREA